MVLPLEPTGAPGVYRRGSRFVVVYRVDGRQRKQSVDTLADAKALKLRRDGEARAVRGHDSVRASTRREYRRLLVNFALTYFDREVRVRDLDRATVQHFVDWLTTRPGRDGRLCDRSIANTLTPLRLALDAAVADGLLDANPTEQVVLPAPSCRARVVDARAALLTRAELVGLLDDVPAKWRPFSSCSPRPGCASLRRSVCAGAISCSTATRRICRCAGRSSRARSSRQGPGTAPGSSADP